MDKMNTVKVGDRTASRRKLPSGFRVDRVVSGFAYGRNGNAYRPTPEYRWEAFHNGVRIGTTGSERGAVEVVSEHAKTLVVVMGRK